MFFVCCVLFVVFLPLSLLLLVAFFVWIDFSFVSSFIN
jgi:hypothetical protein